MPPTTAVNVLAGPPASQPWATKAWRVWLLLGTSLLVAYFTVLPRVRHGDQAGYFLLSAGAAVAIVVGVRLHHPARPWVWYLLAAGMTSWALGDGIWNGLVVLGHAPGYPSIADPLYLLAYPLFGAGLLLWRGWRSPASRAGDVIEAAIVTLGAAMFSWILLMRPYIDAPSVGVLAKAVSIAYPLGDLLLIGVIVPTIGGPGRRSASARFVMGWLGLLLATDTIYSVMVIHNTYAAGSWVDAGWLAGYVLLGAAALHPSMAGPGGNRKDQDAQSIGRLRRALIAMAAIAGPTVIVIEALQRRWADVLLTAGGGLILSGLILIRLLALVREADARRGELDQVMGQLHFQALHDPLTHLANRTLLLDRLDQVLARVRRHQSLAAVLMLDLDDFKAINDGMGHEVGDQILIAVAERLLVATRDCDTVARFGGDEFAVLLDDLDRIGRAVQVAERIVASMAEPIVAAGHTLFVSLSIGIAALNALGDASDGMRQADLALYSAKRCGKGRSSVFTAEMGDEARSRVQLEEDMRQAFGTDLDQFAVYYQPIVELATGRVHGVEALVRWNHPSRGLLLPGAFLPVAEDAGLSIRLGRQVFETACRQVAAWRGSVPGMEELTVSVNLSTTQVEDPGLRSLIKEGLGASGLDPAALTLELTEDLLVSDVNAVDDVLRSLTRLGVKLSVDDFGSGNFSMAYLMRFPIAELKIDKSYVDRLAGSAGDPSPVRDIVDVARALRLGVVAEGIEHRSQAAALTEMGCRLGQGYVFARPQPAELTELTLREGVSAAGIVDAPA